MADFPRSADPRFAAMQVWRAAHPQATLADIEREATRQVAALRRDLMAAALQPVEAAPAVCPTCGGTLVRNGTASRTITTPHEERLTITGPRMRCSACEVELSPPR